MKWVLLFFCVILGLVLLTILILICSTIKFNIAKLNISNLEDGSKKKLEKDIQFFFELYLFGKIRIAKINLNNDTFSKIKNKTKFDFSRFKNIKRDKKMLKNIKVSKVLDILNPEFQDTDLDLKLGTEEVMATVFAVAFISTILGIVFRNANQEKVSFKVMPLYQFGNSINLHLNCIIKVKMVHIIHVIIYLIKEGKVIKSERTSNRRSYDYSYE